MNGQALGVQGDKRELLCDVTCVQIGFCNTRPIIADMFILEKYAATRGSQFNKMLDLYEC